MTKITKQDVEHVARLARIKINEKDKEPMTHEIGEILNYAEEINGAQTQDAQLIGQIAGLENVARNDEITNQNKKDLLLQNAPDQENGFIKVKKVFD